MHIRKNEMPSCNDENKGNNLLDQLKSVLTAQAQKQTDLILKRSADLNHFY